MSGVNGILLVDKPVGMTSADVIRRLKKVLGRKVKIGHLGTLDPFASGVLPVCIGTGTKIAQFLIAEDKAYTGTLRLGIETDTQDGTGTITQTAPVPAHDHELLSQLAQRFCGEIFQTPPMYSAIKQNGVPLYKLARQGIVVERKPRPVMIHSLSLEATGPDTLGFSVSCSKGTYIRTLAADLGAALGCGAYVLSLRRTAFGPFRIEDTQTLDTISDQLEPSLLSLSQALQHYRAVEISPQAVACLRHGQQAPLRDLPPAASAREIIQLVAPDGALVAVAEQHQQQWRLARVL